MGLGCLQVVQGGAGVLQVVQGGAGVFTGSTGWGWGVYR